MISKVELEDHVTRIIGESSDPRNDISSIIDRAGRYLFSMHQWAWRKRPLVDLDFVADQAWVDLPEDFGFGTLLSVTMTDEVSYGVELTTLADIAYLRGQTITPSGLYHVAVAFPNQETTESPLRPARLEVTPTPSSANTGSVTVGYKAGWVPLATGASVANIPGEVEFLLIQIVRGMAIWMETNDRSHLDAIETSPSLERIKVSDGGIQTNSGQMGGGILQPSYASVDHNWNWTGGGGPP